MTISRVLFLVVPTLFGGLVPAGGQTIDVFFLAGQSNADGSNSYYFNNGDPSKGSGLSAANSSYATPYGGITYAYAHANPSDSNMRYLTGGLGNLRPATWGMMGPEISLGRELDTLIDNQVALIKYTSPGTSLNTQWGPDDNLLFPDMVDFFETQINILSQSYTEVRLNTFFWHQGESDSGLTYGTDFRQMFDQLKVELGAPGLNAVMGLVSESFDPGNTGNTPRSNIVAVNGMINLLDASYSDIATTGSLTDIPLHDNVHFDANGQIIHGQRMALAFKGNFLAVPEPGSAALILVGAVASCLRRRRTVGRA